MTAFGKTLFGKALGKGVKIAIDSNPITRSAKNLLSGATSQKKEESKQQVAVNKAAKTGSNPQTSTSENFFKKNKTVLGFTFPLWIWLAIIVAILVLIWLVYKWVFKKRRGAPTRRRASGSSSMRARMARVRAYRKKRK
jgi:flagellar biosynthesis/type III secretory pathway M-ring protein FliF/YscJ